MRRLIALAAAVPLAAPPARAAKAVAPDVAPVSSVQAVPSAVPAASAGIAQPVPIALTAPAVLGAPVAALVPAVPAVPAVPVAAPAAASAADDSQGSARALIEEASAPLSKPGTDAASHLDRVYDSSVLASEDEAVVAAPTAGPSSRRSFLSPPGSEARELERLKVSLAENQLPQYRTAAVSEAVDENRPTVVILSPASRHKVAIAREGGRQSPGDVHLALDASWLVQERRPDGRTRLLLKKGVSFDEHGQATIVEYKVPRVVRYFADYFTLGANDRDDGVPYERNLDVPQSNSLRLEAVVNDKLRMSLLGAAHGVEVPAALTLAMPAHPLAASAARAASGRVSVAAMPEGASKAGEIRRLVDEFVARYDGGEIVVKPSGPQFHSGRGVRFFRKEQRAEIAAHALALSNDPMMTSDGAVIIAGRVNSAPLERDGRKMETTLRVLAARTPWGGTAVTDIYARVGPWGKPTTAEAADPRDNARVEPWERLLADWKLTPRQARELDRRVRRLGATMLDAIIGMEKSLARADGDPYQAQTDLIGLDVMIEKRGRTLVPVMIEVNDHDAGGQFNLDRHIARERAGAHSREWVATMLQRARRDALRGKRIVIVGAGYEGKRPIFELARRLGVEIVLVDSPKSWANDPRYISELIPTDNAKPSEALATARKKLLRSARKNGKVDGITTFWEDDVVLTADLAKELGLPYHAPDAARSARSKFETQAVLARKGVPAARREIVRNLSTAADQKARKAMIASLRKAAAEVGFPAVIKPVSGAAAMGAEKVSSLEEAVAAYKRISGIINPATDPIFAQNSDLLLMQYLDGSEYDVDLVVVAGKPVFESVTDNKPTREPSFLATGSRLPSTLTAEQQKEAIDQAVASAQALGLTDGVIHMEGKYTSEGARLIEANARMGGTYVHDWIKAVWGVDLAEEGLMAAARVPGRPFKPARPIVHLDGDFVNYDKPGVIKVLELPEEARRMPGFVRFRTVKKVGDRITTDEGGGYTRVAMLEVGGKDAAEAARNLAAIKAKIRFVVE